VNVRGPGHARIVPPFEKSTTFILLNHQSYFIASPVAFIFLAHYNKNMTLLETSQIIFNFVISIAVIVVAVLISVIAFDVIKCTNATKKFFEGLTQESAELYTKIDKFLEGLFKLSFLNKLFNKKKKSR
jgi:hypothetical protein